MKTINKCLGVVAYISENYLTKVGTVWKPVIKMKTKKKVKARKKIQDQIWLAAITQKINQEATQNSAKTNDVKKPGEPYKDVLAFSEAGEMSLFMNRN